MEIDSLSSFSPKIYQRKVDLGSILELKFSRVIERKMLTNFHNSYSAILAIFNVLKNHQPYYPQPYPHPQLEEPYQQISLALIPHE